MSSLLTSSVLDRGSYTGSTRALTSTTSRSHALKVVGFNDKRQISFGHRNSLDRLLAVDRAYFVNLGRPKAHEKGSIFLPVAEAPSPIPATESGSITVARSRALSATTHKSRLRPTVVTYPPGAGRSRWADHRLGYIPDISGEVRLGGKWP